MEAITVAHEETCETCKCRIVGVRNHRRGTFVDLCSAHFEMLAEHERAAYGAVESMPFRSDLATPCPAHDNMRLSMFTEVVTKHDIARALEEGTWAELRVRDWDLSGASSLTSTAAHASF
jgi:hypothetical protein